jgi:hypothetical protein
MSYRFYAVFCEYGTTQKLFLSTSARGYLFFCLARMHSHTHCANDEFVHGPSLLPSLAHTHINISSERCGVR